MNRHPIITVSLLLIAILGFSGCQSNRHVGHIKLDNGELIRYQIVGMATEIEKEIVVDWIAWKAEQHYENSDEPFKLDHRPH